jgi:hypothetical protein
MQGKSICGSSQVFFRRFASILWAPIRDRIEYGDMLFLNLRE